MLLGYINESQQQWTIDRSDLCQF